MLTSVLPQAVQDSSEFDRIGQPLGNITAFQTPAIASPLANETETLHIVCHIQLSWHLCDDAENCNRSVSKTGAVIKQPKAIGKEERRHVHGQKSRHTLSKVRFHRHWQYLFLTWRQQAKPVQPSYLSSTTCRSHCQNAQMARRSLWPSNTL
jgi:hypothetical protein